MTPKSPLYLRRMNNQSLSKSFTRKKAGFLFEILDRLREEMQINEYIFIAGEDVAIHGGTYNVSKGLLKEFGEKGLKIPLSQRPLLLGWVLEQPLQV